MDRDGLLEFDYRCLICKLAKEVSNKYRVSKKEQLGSRDGSVSSLKVAKDYLWG